MTKVHGLETLFFGTAVVYTQEEVDQFSPHSDRSAGQTFYILLKIIMLDRTSYPTNEDCIETDPRADLVHCRATGKTETKAAAASERSCIGCKRLACRVVELVVHSQL